MDKEKNNLENILQGIGLSDKEARIYRVLMETGIATAGQLIKTSGLKRGITYNILYKLEKQNLIYSFGKKGKTFFQARPPHVLLELAKTGKARIESIENTLKNILPALSSQYKMAVGKPTIRYFEGEEGIKEVFDDIYGPKNEPVYGCVDLETADATFPSYILKQLIPKRIENRVLACSFVADSPQARAVAGSDKRQLRKTVLLDKKKYPLPAEIDIYEDKIAMLTFARGEFIGIIIDNADLAESLKSVFKYAHVKNR